MTDGDKGIWGKVSARHLKPRTARRWLGKQQQTSGRRGSMSDRKQRVREWGESCLIWGAGGRALSVCVGNRAVGAQGTVEKPWAQEGPPCCTPPPQSSSPSSSYRQMAALSNLSGARCWRDNMSPLPRGACSRSTVPLVRKSRLVNSDHPSIPDIHQELCSTPNH